MNVLYFLAGVVCLLWAAVAVSRRLDRQEQER